MTNKELQDLKRRIKENKYLTKTEVDYIIKALEQEPCEQIKWERDTAIKQLNELGYGLGEKIKPCEDCISRQAVLDGLGSIAKVKAKSDAQKSLMGRVMFFVEQLSPVKPQPKTGRWIIKDGKEQGYDIGGVKTWYIQIMCSECGFIKTVIEGHMGQYNYCPNCGMKMVEPQESEV